MSQLPTDCINEIFAYLENEKDTLFSCLLVNRLWCEVVVRIFWRNSWDYNTSHFRTLIACLPNESKEILYKKEIIISTPTSKPPIFNYASFCKVLSINKVYYKVKRLLEIQQPFSSFSSSNFKNNIYMVVQEICKMFINQTSLKKLIFLDYLDIPYIFDLRSKDCLKNLSVLCCKPSNIS